MDCFTCAGCQTAKGIHFDMTFVLTRNHLRECSAINTNSPNPAVMSCDSRYTWLPGYYNSLAAAIPRRRRFTVHRQSTGITVSGVSFGRQRCNWCLLTRTDPAELGGLNGRQWCCGNSRQSIAGRVSVPIATLYALRGTGGYRSVLLMLLVDAVS